MPDGHKQLLNRDSLRRAAAPEFMMRNRAIHPPAYTPTYKTSVARSCGSSASTGT